MLILFLLLLLTITKVSPKLGLIERLIKNTRMNIIKGQEEIIHVSIIGCADYHELTASQNDA